MKLFFYTTLLLAVSFLTFSCKTKQDQVMKERYRSANKYSTLENKLLRDNNSLLLGTTTQKNNSQDYDNTVNLQLVQTQVNSSEFKVLYDDSEFANGDVYREAAAHRQILIDRAKNKDCNCDSTATKIAVSANNRNPATMPTPRANINTKANSATTPVSVKSEPNLDIKKATTAKTSNVKPQTTNAVVKKNPPTNNSQSVESSNAKLTITANTANTTTTNTSSAKPTSVPNTKKSTLEPTASSNAKATIAANTSNVKPTTDSKKSSAAAAKSTQPVVNQTKITDVKIDAVATAAIETKEAETSQMPDLFAELTDIERKPIRKVGISYVNENDKPLLKEYSVIIASFSQPEKMEPLKRALTSSVDKLFFVKNDANMYYAILGSYNSENEALQKLKRIWMEYTNLYTTDQLNDKYGITFTDLYILKK